MIRFVIVASLLVACGPGSPGGPNMNNSKLSNDLPPPVSSVVSAAILEREPLSNTAQVKHILVSWKDLGEAFGGRQDPRGQKRTKAEAEAQIKALVGQITAGGDFDAIMKTNSEDSGSAASGRPFKVTPDAQLVIEFRQLSLRLRVGEIGVCQSDYGFHIIKRFE
ncbi:MAG: peptidylprolyl isomerase [Kofleriaceae bacterium]